MPDELADVFRRLERIEARQETMLVQLTTIVERQELAASVATAIIAEVGGVPANQSRGVRETLRDRVHSLESAAAAARIAQRALELHSRSVRQAWTQRQKWAVFGFGAITATEGLLRLLGVGG